jgi:P-type conjugative transfer protein TrbJ
MKAKILIFTLISGLFFSTQGFCLFGIGDVVFDPSAVAQMTEAVTYGAKTAGTVANQLQMMLKNTSLTSSSIWGDTSRYQASRPLTDFLQAFANKGGLGAFNSNYQDANAYSNSPCFQTFGCSAADMQNLRDRQQKANQNEIMAYRAQANGASIGQNQLEQDAQTLAALQREAQGASGTNQILGVQNQILAANGNSALALRNQLLQQQNAQTARDAALANKEAIAQAADASMLRGKFVKTNVVDFSKY